MLAGNACFGGETAVTLQFLHLVQFVVDVEQVEAFGCGKCLPLTRLLVVLQEDVHYARFKALGERSKPLILVVYQYLSLGTVELLLLKQ